LSCIFELSVPICSPIMQPKLNTSKPDNALQNCIIFQNCDHSIKQDQLLKLITGRKSSNSNYFHTPIDHNRFEIRAFIKCIFFNLCNGVWYHDFLKFVTIPKRFSTNDSNIIGKIHLFNILRCPLMYQSFVYVRHNYIE